MTPTSVSRRTIATLSICILSALICGTIVFTRFGAFLVFDVLADIGGPDTRDMTYHDAPVHVSFQLEDPQQINVPKEIEQISGLVRQEDQLFLSTDQSEVFSLDLNGKTNGGNVFPFTPLLIRQGRLEAITWTGLAFGLVGEFGAMMRVDGSFNRLENQSLPPQIEGLEFSGLTSAQDRFYFTTDDTAKVTTLDRVTGAVGSFDLDFGLFVKPGMSTDKLRWSGTAFDEGLIYLSSADYPMIVVANAADGDVVTVFGIDGTTPFSDISIENALLYLPRDHNYFDARPPILVFDLKNIALKDLSS